MITRTENGYALNGWEGVPTKLASGARLTPGEVRAAVCRVNGLNAIDAGRELHCSKNTVYQYWKSIKFKIHCDDVVVAINKMIELGALHRLQVLMLAVYLGAASIASAYSVDDDIERRGRTRRTTQRTKGSRRTRSAGATLGGMFAQLDDWLGGTAGDIYTYADMRGAA